MNHPIFKLTVATFTVLSLVFWLRGIGPIKGSDADEYLEMYQQISGFASLSSIYYMNDPVFSTVSYLLNVAGFTGLWYLRIVAVIFIAAVVFTLCVITRNDSRSSFLLGLILVLGSSSFYLMTVNAVRQGLAFALIISCCALLFAFPKSKYNIWWKISALTAILVHKAVAPIALALFLQRRLQLNSCLLFIYFATVLGLLIEAFLPDVFGMIGLTRIESRIIALDRPSSGSFPVWLKVIFHIVFSHILWLAALSHRDLEFRRWVKLFLVSFSVMLMFIGYESVINRFMLALGLMEAFLIISSMRLVKEKKLLKTVLMLSSIMYIAFVFSFPSIQSELLL